METFTGPLIAAITIIFPIALVSFICYTIIRAIQSRHEQNADLSVDKEALDEARERELLLNAAKQAYPDTPLATALSYMHMDYDATLRYINYYVLNHFSLSLSNDAAIDESAKACIRRKRILAQELVRLHREAQARRTDPTIPSTFMIPSEMPGFKPEA